MRVHGRECWCEREKCVCMIPPSTNTRSLYPSTPTRCRLSNTPSTRFSTTTTRPTPLRARLVDCVSLIGQSVDKERFFLDAIQCHLAHPAVAAHAAQRRASTCCAGFITLRIKLDAALRARGGCSALLMRLLKESIQRRAVGMTAFRL
jgi:hypothetical protein